MKICLVCTHGGHLTELLQLMEAFDGHQIFFLTFDDKIRTRNLKSKYKCYLVKYREGKNLGNIVYATLKGIKTLLKERPDLIVSTGSEIAIPIFYIAKLFRIKSIFLESCCSINDLSLTGKLVYPVADLFLVQWLQLTKRYRKAKYWGGIL